MTEATLSITNPDEILTLFGPRDQHLRKLAPLVRCEHHSAGRSNSDFGRGRGRSASHADARKAAAFVPQKGELSAGDVDMAASEEGARCRGAALKLAGGGDEIEIQHAGRRIKPRTPGQATYVESIRAHDLTFATGPAGCGKTYLAVATAVEALRAGQVRKIVLVRPAVEAGESLGFLPGDFAGQTEPIPPASDGRARGNDRL